MVKVTINGSVHDAIGNERLIDLLNRIGTKLAGYEVLQGLHDRGVVLELLRGVLGGGDRILEIAVEAAKTPEAIRGIRNLIIMLKLAGSTDLDQLHATLEVGHKQAPSLREIGKLARTDDARRGMKAAVALLGIFGAALNNEQRAKNN